MAASDPVPCYYTGQNYRWERPAEIRTRAEVRQLKSLKLGQFVESGKIFLFFQKVAEWATQNWNGRVGVGTLLHFIKTNNYGDKLHYETPHAGDRSIFARHHRSRISVSSRPAFSQPGVQWMNYVRPA